MNIWPFEPKQFTDCPCITIDGDSEVRHTTLRKYRNGVIAVKGIGKWYEANSDGTVLNSYIKKWKKV